MLSGKALRWALSLLLIANSGQGYYRVLALNIFSV